MSNDPLDLHRRRSIYKFRRFVRAEMPDAEWEQFATVATPAGDSVVAQKAGVPFPEKGASRRRAQTLGVPFSLPFGVQPSAAATGRTGTLDLSPVFSPA